MNNPFNRQSKEVESHRGRWLALAVITILIVVAVIDHRWFIPLLILIPSIVLLITGSKWAHRQHIALSSAALNAPAPPDAPVTQKMRAFSRTHVMSIARIAAEITIVTLASMWVAENYFKDEPNRRLAGHEMQWITSSTYSAAMLLPRYGYIPLWQPNWELGKPLVEDPFSFILNPFASLPVFLLGGLRGIKVSAGIAVIIAGLGGWMLGYALGLRILGRILLAFLLIGKGGMLAMMREGYFQLASSQSYIAWVTAGLLLTIRGRKRWPIVLTALSFTLLFFSGNLYFTLPTAILMGFLILSHLLFHKDNAARAKSFKRLALAGALTMGLSAVLLLPVGLNFKQVGSHPDEGGAGTYADLGDVLRTYTQPVVDLHLTNEIVPTWSFFGYVYLGYVTPFWFLLLLFVALPPLIRWLYRPALRDEWRIWVVGLLLIAFFTLWGAGRLELIYEYFSPIRQWRYVGRILSMAAFWIAVLVAMRADSLWRVLLPAPSSERSRTTLRDLLRIAFATGFAAVCFYAGYHVMMESKDETRLEAINQPAAECLRWLRNQHPGEQLAVYREDFDLAWVYVENELRLPEIIEAPGVLPLENTIGHFRLPAVVLPPYSVPQRREYMGAAGYSIIPNSPRIFDSQPCAFRYTAGPVLSYAFSASIPDLEAVAANQFPVDLTTPITTVESHYDKIALRVTADDIDPLVVAVQEVSYPGWRVSVDGAPADLQVIAGLIGVTIPPDGAEHYVYFQYVPPLLIIGGTITIIAALLCISYLLRLDRFIPARWRNRPETIPPSET
ncbi:MAG: hypothetical protein H7175_07040 [Burkholderiales bacterium]|nr:hypothetical protein [Anaerolineae bacterium]